MAKKLSQSRFIQRANKLHRDVYIYDETVFINTRTKIIIKCRIHGAWLTSPNSHLKGHGCPKCASGLRRLINTKTTDSFINSATNIHDGLYTYTEASYIGANSKIKIICKDHGAFYSTPSNHVHYKSGCPDCKNFVSSTEVKIQTELFNTGVEFEASNRIKIAPQELDLYLPENNVAIEVNGIYWHSTKFKDDKNYHLNKTTECEKQGIQLLHFWDFEVDNKFDIVTSMIMARTGNIQNKVYARKCEIVEITDNKIVNNFLEHNHLQGKCASSLKLGLYFNKELKCIMTFGKSRFCKNHKWELIRFCNKLDTTVVGGASKLFTYFIKNHYDDTGIISYANLRYSSGNLYKNLNFTEYGKSKPSYFYTGRTVVSRYRAQKHLLSDLLGAQNFDANLSEQENMNNNMYYRVYDCGNLIYTYK